MEEVKLICKACGAETMRLPKPEPVGSIQSKQIYFICADCGAVNLRDGTACYRPSLKKKNKPDSPDRPPEEKEINRRKDEEGASIGKVIVSIAVCVLGVVTFIFLRKSIKGQGNGPGNNSGSSGKSDSFPFSSIH